MNSPAAFGQQVVVSFTLGEKTEPVYNSQIDGDHCYRVGEQGILVHNTNAGQSTPGPATPTPATIPQIEVDAVRARWAIAANDVGLGLYNPCTGEIHLSTFDTGGQGIGHDGLQMTLGIPDADRPQWRGFVFSSGGQALNVSGFNVPDGSAPSMRADYYVQVQDALRRAGLI